MALTYPHPETVCETERGGGGQTEWLLFTRGLSHSVKGPFPLYTVVGDDIRFSLAQFDGAACPSPAVVDCAVAADHVLNFDFGAQSSEFKTERT